MWQRSSLGRCSINYNLMQGPTVQLSGELRASTNAWATRLWLARWMYAAVSLDMLCFKILHKSWRKKRSIDKQKPQPFSSWKWDPLEPRILVGNVSHLWISYSVLRNIRRLSLLTIALLSCIFKMYSQEKVKSVVHQARAYVSVKWKLQHPSPGIPRAFDIFSCLGGREFD